MISEIKLNIGCADYKIPGFINIDIRETTATDIVTAAWNLYMYGSKTVSAIYCRHTFEHLDLNEAVLTLVEWRRVLVDGGTVNIIVPDLEFHCKQLLERANDSKELSHALAGFYGWCNSSRGGHAYDVHKWGYTQKTLTAMLSEHGFVNIIRRVTGGDSAPHHLNLEMVKHI